MCDGEELLEEYNPVTKCDCHEPVGNDELTDEYSPVKGCDCRKNSLDKEFNGELSALINKHSLENDSDTADSVLADFVCASLLAYNRAVRARRDMIGEESRPRKKYVADELSASEALYGFMSWLITRPDEVVFLAKHESSVAVDLITAFCKANNLKKPRKGWHNLLTHPKEVANEKQK